MPLGNHAGLNRIVRAGDRKDDYMRKALVIAAGLAFIATSASSQSSFRDDDRRDRRDSPREWRDRDNRGDHSMRDDDNEHGRAARFVLSSGDSRLVVKCDDRESMRACVDAALSLMDRARSYQGATGGTSGSTTPPPPPAR